jgi:WD40 repeat protein
LQLPSSSVISVLKFFPGGSRFVSGTKDGILTVWDIAAGRSLFTVDDHPGKVACVAVSATEEIVASAYDQEIHIWDVESRIPIMTLKSSASTKGLCFSPNSTRLASWGAIRVELWSVQKGDLISSARMGSNTHISSFTFRDDGISRKYIKPGEWKACSPTYILDGYSRGCIFHAELGRAIAIIPPRINHGRIPFSGARTASAFAHGGDVVVMHFPPALLEKWELIHPKETSPSDVN